MDEFLELGRSPVEALRLLNEWRADGRAAGSPYVDAMADWAAQHVRAGDLLGTIWVGPRDEGIGLAWGELIPRIGWRYCVHLSEGFRQPGSLRRLAEHLAERPSDVVALYSLNDLIPGVPATVQSAALAPLGLFHVAREDLIFPASTPLPEARPPAPPMRTLNPEDAPRLTRLLQRAYAEDPVERALFLRTHDPAEDARLGVEGLLGTEVGEWMPSASFGVDDGGELAAATLVNRFAGVLLSEVMVAPAQRRRGLATHLIRASLEALRAANEPAPRLVVTVRNRRAYRLYQRLGFERVENSVGGFWVNLPALGIAAPPATVE